MAVDLVEYVEASNAIEGFLPSVFGHRSRHPVFTQHLAVARRIAMGETMTAEAVHAATFAGLAAAGLRAGEPRRTTSMVGEDATLDPRRIVEAMRAWEADAAAGPGRNDPDAWCWAMHHRFAAIHPFPDGNGRTARLLLNRLRLRAGLPWLTIGVEDGPAYVDAIRRWRAASGH